MMKTKTICFASAKGGSGKTIISASLANLLSFFGMKVLLIDTDASTNGLTLLFLEELVNFKTTCDEKEYPNVVGIFEGQDKVNPTSFPINDNLHFIPASYVLRQTEDCSKQLFEELLPNVIQQNKNKYDYIILDAQAGSDEFARVSIKNSNTTVIVSEYDPISAEGVERLKSIFSAELSYDNTWVLLNKVLPEFSKSLTKYLSIFRFLSPIPWDADVVRSFATRKLCLDMKNVNEYTLAIIKVAKSLLGKELEEKIDDWLETKESYFREPAKKQLDETEQRIVELEKIMIDTDYEIHDLQNKSSRVSKLIGSVLTSMFAGAVIVLFTTKGIDFFTDSYKSLVPMVIAIPVTAFMVKDLFDRVMTVKFREKTKHYEEMKLAYKRKLEELRIHKSKISTILESDIENLLLKKK